MEQAKITTVPGAIAAAGKAADAATVLGDGIGIKNNTGAVITAEKNALVVADTNHKAAKAALAAEVLAYKALLLVVIGFIALVRDVFKPHFGNKPSANWEQLGFVGKLMIPRTLAGVRYILERMFQYLNAHPDKEVPAINVTKDRLLQFMDELDGLDSSVRAKRTALSNAKKAKDEKLQAVIKRMSNLFGELKAFLTPLDARWTQFGFKLPGASAIPDVPVNIIAVFVGRNAVTLQWAPSARAEYYRVWKKVNGVDTEMVVVGTPADGDFLIEGLPANTPVEISVSAVNNGGESALSAVVLVTTAA
jgi:hypothetical protein